MSSEATASTEAEYDAGQQLGQPASSRRGREGNAERELFTGDTGSYPLEIRQTLVRLLRGPYVDGSADAALWNTVVTHKASLQQFLSEIFLLLTIDPERKIAVLEPAAVEAVHAQPIVARRPLRREETLLALRLRLLLEKQSGTENDVTVSRATAREILLEHKAEGSLDDKKLSEQSDAAIARLLALKLLLPTELPNEFRVSNALALALPFDSVDEIPAYIASLESSLETSPEAPLELNDLEDEEA